MASWLSKSSKDHHSKEEGQDLSSLLSTEERIELTLLIAKITESMSNTLVNVTFDASITNKSSFGFNTTENDSSEINQKAVSHNARLKEDASRLAEDEKSRQFMEQRQKELSEPKQQELKRALSEHMQQWQDGVTVRIGEAVNARKEADESRKAVESLSPDPKSVVSENKKISSHTNNAEADAMLAKYYSSTQTLLKTLPQEKRVTLLKSVLLLVLSLEHYSAYSRILLLHLCSSLQVPLHHLSNAEVEVAQGLMTAAKNMSGDEETAQRNEDNKTARRWKVGLAGVAGAAVIGITGGLAAPLVAAGLGTVMGGLGLGATAGAALLGTLAESGVIVGALFGAYGANMTGKMMDAYAKEVSDFAFLPLRGDIKRRNWKGKEDARPEDRRLRVSIGISGWLTRPEDIIDTWRVLGHQSEVFALRWELQALMNLGTSMESVLKNYAWGLAKKEIISRTIFAGLMSALWPLGLLKVSKVVDNAFSVAKNRADKAGLVLADALINKAQGERPVTLIGYSLGARMIYSCLMSLAERKAFGLVESVVLMGAPTPSDAKVWRTMRSVVAGRLVNVYSENDYILAYLYRTSSIQWGIAGIQEIEDVPNVESVNVSDMVNGHLKYQYLVGSILEKIGWEDLDVKEIAKEEETLALLEQEKENELKDEQSEERKVPEKEVREPEVIEKESSLQKGMAELQINK